MNIADLSDAEVLQEGGDGLRFPLKAHKARAFAEEIVRLRREHRNWLDAEAERDAALAQVSALRAALLKSPHHESCDMHRHLRDGEQSQCNCLVGAALSSAAAAAAAHDAAVRRAALEEAAVLVGPRNYKLNDGRSDIPNAAREKLQEQIRALAAKAAP